MDAESQQSRAFYEFLAWLEVNKKQVALGGGALLLAGAVVGIVLWYQGHQEVVAAQALSNIHIPYSPGEPVSPDTADKLHQLARSYAGTAAARRAVLVRAGLLFTEGKYAEAQAAFEEFIRQYPDSPWLPEAVFGVAVCLDAQNKTNEAVLKYEEFARRFPSDSNVDQARLNLAALHEAAQKPADALREYDRIIKPGALGGAANEAQDRRRALLAKYPHLAPTNPPAVTPSVSLPLTNLVTNVVSRARTNGPGPAPTNPPLNIRTSVPAQPTSPTGGAGTVQPPPGTNRSL